MSEWIYNGKYVTCLEDFPEGAIGFIYEIKNITTGKGYIGRKILKSTRKIKPLKGAKRKRTVIKDSGWREYTGSCEELNNDIAKGHVIEKYIEEMCFSKKQMSYYELKYQMIREVLESDRYYNGNIAGKYHRRDLIKKS
jgi:hypothetical protein